MSVDRRAEGPSQDLRSRVRGPSHFGQLGCFCSRSGRSYLMLRRRQLEPESAGASPAGRSTRRSPGRTPTPVLELTGIKVPDGMPAGWKPLTGMIHPAVDWGGPASASQPSWESRPAISGAEVDHAARRIDENP